MDSECYNDYNNITPRSSDTWIEFDFVNKVVNLTSYTIQEVTARSLGKLLAPKIRKNGK